VVPVLTKSDKLSRQAAISRSKRIQKSLATYLDEKPVVFSSKTRMGRDEVWEKINRAIGL
jgi:GTP-binding protein EngB required for normal cell division